jgi:hypothetical protein
MEQGRWKGRGRSAGEEISSFVELEEGSLLCSQELFTFPANIFHPDVTVLFSQPLVALLDV